MSRLLTCLRGISGAYKMASNSALQRLEQRAAETDQIIAQLRGQLQALKDAAVAKVCKAEEEKLRKENAALLDDVEQLKRQLVEVECRNGIAQVAMPNHLNRGSAPQTAPPPAANAPPPPSKEEPKAPSAERKQKEKPQKEKKEKTESKAKAPAKGGAAADEKPIDVSRLHMRVGQIVDVKKHPDADSLYVEEVNVGEEKNRTVVSGLVNHVPIEQMQNRIAIFMLNLKPAKMRGIVSEGMIMCGSSPEKVEIIVPPEGVQIGQQVTVEGYPGEPDTQLNPKKKIWEQVQPDLRIDNQGVATYKGTPWTVEGKGPCTVPTMRDSAIK